MKEGRENETVLVLTGEPTSESGWKVDADATLIVNDLRDCGAIFHVCILCNGMAHASDIGLVGAIVLFCMVT